MDDKAASFVRAGSTRGVVLAGGHSWDDSDFDELSPRPLMPVAHTPLVCHLLGWLRAGGVGRATLCANSASRQMRRTLADGSALGIELEYYEDWAPRGPAGCVRDAAISAVAERVVVIDGTILPECALHELLEQHVQSEAAMSVVAARESANADRLVPAGIYVLDHSVLKWISATGYQDVKEVLLPLLYEKGVRVRVHTLSSACPRITDADSYLTLHGRVLERLLGEGRELAGYRRVGQSMVHESARVPAPSRFSGPVLIGPRTVIASDATLVGPLAVGAQCVIESGAVVCNSVVWDGCWVERGAAVNHCVLGHAAAVAAEAILFHTVVFGAAGGPARVQPATCLESLLFPLTSSQECSAVRGEGVGQQPAGKRANTATPMAFA